MRKNRSFNKDEIAPTFVLIHDHTGTGDVGGHQVHGELNPVKTEIQNAGERTHQKRFARSRHALDQHMTAGKKGDQNIANELLMADDDLGQFGLNLLKAVLKFKNKISCRCFTHCTASRENSRFTMSSYSGGTWAFRMASSNAWFALSWLVDLRITPPPSSLTIS